MHPEIADMLHGPTACLDLCAVSSAGSRTVSHIWQTQAGALCAAQAQLRCWRGGC